VQTRDILPREAVSLSVEVICMRSFIPSVAVLALALALGACAPSVSREIPTVGARSARATGWLSRDTAAVHRLCMAPDCVLAGLRACELRDQSPPLHVY